jgi:ABC-type branched-subunit amino acid transport system ATPase component
MIDEMSLGLSPLVVQEISRIIKDINKSRRIAVFLVEQDVNMALSIADRGYIVENGRIHEIPQYCPWHFHNAWWLCQFLAFYPLGH